MSKKTFTHLALLVAFSLTGCAGTQTTVQQPKELQLLKNTTWVLTDIGGTEINRKGSTRNIPTIYFDINSSQMNGSDGCNRFVGRYEATTEFIRFSPIAGTRMMCLNGMDIAKNYQQALAKVQAYQVYGHTLKLLDRHGNPVLQYRSDIPLQ